jgi:hypothetical protein
MDPNAMMKEMMAGPFGGAASTPTRKPMEDALKEHLTVKVGWATKAHASWAVLVASTTNAQRAVWAQGEEIVAGTVQLARDLNRRSYMDRAVSWLPGALLSRQASIVNTNEVRCECRRRRRVEVDAAASQTDGQGTHAVQTLSKMPAMLADIEENMDATLRRYAHTTTRAACCTVSTMSWHAH